ncbi:MAG: SDR family oxidoreductase [Saprospiraceae bacterium]|nr:SDR family oxidoreductase [Saprospiraceae bacterium]
MKDLSGKKILITGGGGIGVGAGVSQVLIGYGADLIITELNQEKAAQARLKYPTAQVLVSDVRKSEDVEALFKIIEEEHGNLDGLVNNAGVGLTKNSWEATEAEFENLYQVDIYGVWRMSRAFVQHLLDSNRTGSIVNISSVHASATAPNYAIYSSAKAAVEALTKGMAVELGASGIRANAVAPGLVHAEQNYDLIRAWTNDPHQWVKEHTEDHQVLRHLIQPDDCGQAVAFLLSDLSSSITGQILHVDNGMTLQLYNNKFMKPTP